MEIILNKKDFLKVLDNGGIFAGRYKALPILDNVKIRIKNDSLNVVSSDNENAVSCRIGGMNNGIDEELSFCVNCKDVRNYVKLVAGDDVKFIIKDSMLTIKHKKGKTKMPIFPCDDFPIIAMDKEYTEVKVPSALVNNWIVDGQGFTSSDTLRPALTGIYFYGEGREFGCCASEGHVLFHDSVDMDIEKDFDFILSKTSFKAVCNVCSEAEEDLSIRIGERSIMFSARDISVIARRIDAVYPKFKQIIPNEFNLEAHVGKEDVLDSLNRCICSANPKAPLAKIEIKEHSMELQCQDIDFNTSASEFLDVDCVGEMLIGTNANSLMNALNIFQDGDINMRFISESRPIVLKSDLEPNKLALVMPMLLNY